MEVNPSPLNDFSPVKFLNVGLFQSPPAILVAVSGKAIVTILSLPVAQADKQELNLYLLMVKLKAKTE
jgi:hypothetical protein